MKYMQNSLRSSHHSSQRNGHVVHEVTISTSTIMKVGVIVAALVFAFMIRSVLGMLFVSWVLASAIDPWVDALERYRIPRTVTILCLYLLCFLVFGLMMYLLIPAILDQMNDIVTVLKQYTPQIEAFYQSLSGKTDGGLISQLQENITSINATFSNLTTQFFQAISNFFSRILTVIVVLVLAFYMTVEQGGMKKFVRSIAPIQYQPYLIQKTNIIQQRMGAWLRGQLILMLIIGMCSLIGLWIMHVPYALILAIISGLLEFLPFLGPIIAAVPAIFFAASISWWKAIAVAIFFFVLQQVENQVIVPKVMERSVGLNSIVVLTVLMIGGIVAGIPGIILAVPATTIVWIFLEDIFVRKQKKENTLEESTDEE